jgi:RNA polymerase sigma-70 factor (ECF subfamily)
MGVGDPDKGGGGSGALALPRPVTEVSAGSGEDLFRALFLQHSGAVHRFLRDLVRDDAQAEECLQETFVRAHDRLRSLRERDRALAWLLGIARNVTLELRRARRWQTAEASPPERACPAPSPETVLLGREEVAAVEQAMAALGEDRRAALLLRFDHGLPYEEIAAALGWSLSKAKVEVHRARLKLRTALEGGEP